MQSILRGGSPQIFVDGKPTNLNLNQIPAAEIERVEVITNASAKYDANTTGGIVNIVMKKNTKPGINGMTNLGIGTNGRYNGMANLNVKQNPFNHALTRVMLTVDARFVGREEARARGAIEKFEAWQ